MSLMRDPMAWLTSFFRTIIFHCGRKHLQAYQRLCRHRYTEFSRTEQAEGCTVHRKTKKACNNVVIVEFASDHRAKAETIPELVTPG